MKTGLSRIGFMQGRLSPPARGRIQCFPVETWKQEFTTGRELGFEFLEWTLDNDTYELNPLITASGRQEITALCRQTGLSIHSLTGDTFMESPFYKQEGSRREALLDQLKMILLACDELGIRFCVIPLVDNGRLESEEQVESLNKGLLSTASDARLIFESDYHPSALAKWINSLPASRFGINYDIGNSASLGFDPGLELTLYGERVWNVHVKDRILGGTTVALGTGAAQLARVFQILEKQRYAGNFILQTARAQDGGHVDAIIRYRNQVTQWLEGAKG